MNGGVASGGPRSSSLLSYAACPCSGLPGYLAHVCCWRADGADADGAEVATPVSVRSSNLSTWSSSPRLRPLDDRLLALEVQRKIVVLGFRGVGKSALITRFVEGQFLDSYEPTIEYTFRTTLVRNHVRFVCDILDTSAQDEYSSLSRQASVGVHGYVLVYSCTSRTSFDNVKVIHDKVLKVIGGATVPMALVATKQDLEDYREVLGKEGQALASRWGYPFIECSAKTNWNVDQVFKLLLTTIERESGLLTDDKEDSCALL
jgi:Ras family protein